MMKCQRCEKEREQTFYRVGGDYDLNGEMREIRSFDSVCLPCIKKKMLRGTIITNPTIKPSGDPLEWVLNE